MIKIQLNTQETEAAFSSSPSPSSGLVDSSLVTTTTTADDEEDEEDGDDSNDADDVISWVSPCGKMSGTSIWQMAPSDDDDLMATMTSVEHVAPLSGESCSSDDENWLWNCAVVVVTTWWRGNSVEELFMAETE